VPLPADVDELPVVVDVVDDVVVVVVSMEMRLAVASAVGVTDDREPLAEAGEDIVAMFVSMPFADRDVVVVAVETSANISEPMLDETSPPAANDTGPNHTSQ